MKGLLIGAGDLGGPLDLEPGHYSYNDRSATGT